MTKYFKIIAIVAAAFFINCEADDETKLSKFVGFETSPIYLELPKNSTDNTKEVTIAASETVSSDRTYSIYVDESSTFAPNYTVPSTVTIPANSNLGTFTVTFSDDDNLDFFDQFLVIQFDREEGLDFSDELVFTLTELCEETLVNLFLEFDSYPTEAVFELYDLSDTSAPLYTGGSGSEYAGLTDFSIRFCLEPGNYLVAVYDLYGDGGTDFTLTYKSDGSEIASGSSPDAGSGYPVVTNVTAEFTID
ncbi:hypothetical protein [Winogradskyella thalassocola]|uniref:DUF1735 domain-containing protein n=1 Tax=Winogradskyella thalassocola TaxID=262004 RepID=A0A1G8KAY5_9FLAO|nr:hypothetical protein [Winogradskyella thalassocola]SDI40557.1 hypothetical protein SAMN04489796_110126 [Winogradskyella thalassocola]